MTEQLLQTLAVSPNRRHRGRATGILTGALLTLAACSDKKDTSGASDNTNTDNTTVEIDNGNAASNSNASDNSVSLMDGAKITFNDLDETADALIGVYADYSVEGAGSAPVDSFAPGVVWDAICTATGRTVTSRPENGDEYRSSDQWLGITDHNGQRAYATQTYLDVDESALASLPPC